MTTEITISADGVTELQADDRYVVTHHRTTTVVIRANVDAAVLTFGLIDSSDDFTAFPDGIIADGNIINHGIGCRLAVSIAGIGVNPVELSFFGS